MDTVFGISELLDPISVGQFFESHWQKKPLHVQRCCRDFYGKLFTLAELDALLAVCARRNAPIKVSYSESPGSDRRTDLVGGAHLFGQLYGGYCAGNTLVADRIHHGHPKISKLLGRLSEAFGTVVEGMVVLSPPGSSPGFAAHWDPVELLVLQLSGLKRWFLWRPNCDLPLPHTPQEYVESANLGKPDFEILLDAGDLLYVPRGWIHRVAVEGESPSLHLSAMVTVCSRAELVMEALYVAMDEDVWFREALPADLFRLTAVDLEHTCRAGIERLTLPGVLQEAFRRLRSNIIGKLQPVADGHFLLLSSLETISEETLVRRRPGALAQLSFDQTQQQLLLEFPGNRVIAPPEFAPVLSWILAADTFAARDLPGSLAPEIRVELVRRLVKEGLLSIANQIDASPSI